MENEGQARVMIKRQSKRTKQIHKSNEGHKTKYINELSTQTEYSWKGWGCALDDKEQVKLKKFTAANQTYRDRKCNK